MFSGQRFTSNYNNADYSGPYTYEAARLEIRRLEGLGKEPSLVFVGLDFFINHSADNCRDLGCGLCQ